MSGEKQIPKLNVENYIVLHDLYRQRAPQRVNKLILHRISFREDGPNNHYPELKAIPDEHLRAGDIHERFQDTRPGRAGSYTGGKTPYTFLLTKDWTFQQMAEVSDITPHARRWNTSGVSTAVVGDFRTDEIDWATFEYLVIWGALWTAYGCTIHGHTEMRNATRNNGKQCPGPGMKLPKLREAVASHPWSFQSKKWARQYLEGLGVVF